MMMVSGDFRGWKSRLRRCRWAGPRKLQERTLGVPGMRNRARHSWLNNARCVFARWQDSNNNRKDHIRGWYLAKTWLWTNANEQQQKQSFSCGKILPIATHAQVCLGFSERPGLDKRKTKQQVQWESCISTSTGLFQSSPCYGTE